MQKHLVLLLILFLTSCTWNKGDSLGDLMKDPHYQRYMNKQDAVESAYLREEISYYEYLEKKRRIDQQYDWEVKRRHKIMQGGE